MSANRLPYLKGRRTILRKSIPEKLTHAEKLLTADQFNDDLLTSINTAIRDLTENAQRLESLTEEIIDLMGEPTDAEIEAEATKIEADIAEINKILHGLAEKRDQFQKLTHPPGSPTANATLEAQMIQLKQDMEHLRMNPPLMGDQLHSGGASVRLPTLEVEKFDGDLLRFKEFWDHFEVAIGKNPRLRPVEKLNYLRAYLSGEAKRVIAGFTATDENYEVAATLLKERYGDAQASIDAHYSRLTDLQSAPNQTTKIRLLLDKIESHLRCLEALGEDIEHRHFISLISSKLPRDLVAHLEEMKGARTPWSVQLLRSSLHNVLNAREIAERQNEHPARDQRSDNRYSNVQRKDTSFRSNTRSTTETLMANDKSPLRQPKTPCIYCNRTNHFHSDCRTVNSLTKRRDKIRQLRRCFICLKEGHSSKACKNGKRCYYCHEMKSHHQSLCPKQFAEAKPMKESATVAADSFGPNSTAKRSSSISAPCHSSKENDATLAVGEKVILQTALVKLFNPKKSKWITTRALLDSGSNRTYVTSAVSKALNLEPDGEEFFSIGTFGSEKRKTIKTSNAQMLMQLMDGSRKMMAVNVVDHITGSITRVPIDVDIGKYLGNMSSNGSTLPLADPLPQENERSDIGILIGNDYYLDLINPDRIEINPGLYLLSSRLGWLITGRIEESSCMRDDVVMFIDSRFNVTDSPQLDPFPGSTPDKNIPISVNMQDIWSLDTIGIKDSPDIIDDDRAMDNFNRTVKVTEEGRYQVTWPWKDEEPDLPTNYQLSLGRFRAIVKKFQSNKDLFTKYRDIIREQENLGIIEKVSNQAPRAEIKHYIPHHPVVTPGKETTKVRIVYDASAKVSKTASSLNECLYRGPIMLEDLCGILLRFRLNRYAVTADIEKAFLQVSLQESARNVTRFFWLKDDMMPIVDGNVQEYRFCRVPFGVISSPFLLAATIQFHLSTLTDKRQKETATKIKDGLYVDNVITGFDSEEEVLEFYKEAKAIFRSAAMNLRQWMSNCTILRQQIIENDLAASSVVKVLGIPWNTSEDTLSISISPRCQSSQASTKRHILQQVASFFDPLGLFSPITLKAKLLLREICQSKLEWDETLAPTTIEKWKPIATDLIDATNVTIPRCVTMAMADEDKGTVFDLMCFCDASASAFAAAVYLKSRCSTSSAVNLIFSKTRLSPNKKITIPRMELMALLIGVRSINFVERHLNVSIESKTVWTDSTCVLYWLKSNRRKSIFVDNRLKEIKKSTDLNFRYVNTTDNPADVATRGSKTVTQLTESTWWNGPRWLRLPQTHWPAWIEEQIPSTTDLEEKESKVCQRLYEAGLYQEAEFDINARHDPPTTSTARSNSGELEAPFNINPERFSSLSKLYRITAWATRFISRLRKFPASDDRLSSVEIVDAKLKWDKHIQVTYFAEIYKAISMKSHCNLKDQLNIQVDEAGILRCHGRFLHSNLPYERRYPKLLPKTSHYTNLVITSIHERNLHAGVSFTLAQLRQEYWIPQGRSTVKTVLKNCRICRKYQGGPYAVPIMPPYPAARINRSPPFSYVGLDYLGPLLVKTSDEQATRKVWICLYTCMVVRAIHLELAEDMTAEQFLLSLRRFIARRGKPVLIISDNASQFKLAKNALDRLYGNVIADDAVKSYTSSSQIAWKYITERAPWMGGFYERLVGTVKNALKKTIGKLLLSTVQLQTCLTEIEALINRRPLAPVTDSVEDSATLTPNHFLTLNPKVIDRPATNPGQIDYNIFPTAAELLLSWKKGISHLNQFWKVWHADYLNALRQRCDVKHTEPKVKQKAFPSVDDVVLVKERSVRRGKWTIARIVEVYTSGDGHVRSVKLTIPGGRYIRRATKLLYPLEMSGEQPLQIPAQSTDGEPTDKTPSSSSDRVSSTATPTKNKTQTSFQSGEKEPSIPSQRLPRNAKLQAQEALKLVRW